MVKNKVVKKEEKGPPKDQFDPLLVESSQAATVVLMLESAEEEILLRSMEAIYKFVQKCDDNKKQLWDLHSVPLLMKLLQNENKSIHRNACMVLGVMSRLREVQLFMKKTEETIPTLIRLLNSDEEAVVHEYAALCLSNIAKHFTGICQIREKNGIEALIRCLNSPDQDIKYNAIETITLMLEDYETRTAVRQFHGLPPIMELLKSEYPDIQFKALISLQKITEELDNRTALRELGAMTQLVDFVGTPIYSEFHVLAIKILSNCFEDVETIRVIKENGVLSRLVSIVTDAPPPPPPKQEEKKAKKEKPPSRAGKKSKDEKIPSNTALNEPMPFTPTLPEVKEHVSFAIARCAKNVEIRKLLQEHEIEKMLILFLGHSDAKVQIAASQGLRVMAENLLSRECTGKFGGIPPLVKIIIDKADDVKEAALTALNVLTSGNDFNCFEVSKSKGTRTLLSLLSSSREITLSNALGTLINMAKEDELRQEILKNNLVSCLSNPLLSENHDVQAKIALAVATFVLNPIHRQQLIELNGIQPLVMMLDSSNNEVRRNSTMAIVVLTEDASTAEEICRLGGLDVLRSLQNSEMTKNAYTDEAVVKLLEHNLSAKYALIGKLCPKDVISDGFYDVGKIRTGSGFLPLVEYHQQPVNGGRPVFVVYAPTALDRNEKEDISTEIRKCTTMLEKSEANDDRSNVDSGAEGEPSATSTIRFSCPAFMKPPPYMPHVDTRLLQYVEEIRDILQPLEFCNLHERVVLLARFVAGKMGGSIERGKQFEFSWDLPISQLKYQLKSNVIPIGLVTTGIHYHRALLFKVLGDRVGIPSSLVRGECNLAWNEVYIEEKPMKYPRYPAKIHIVDLVYEPGKLMRADSPEAAVYVTP